MKSLLSGVDITKLHLQKVGKYQAVVGAAAAYARQDLALCDIEASELHRQISHLEAMISAGQSDKITQWRIKALCRRDVRWQKLSERYAVAWARKMMLQSLVESLDARSNLLSREITRRQLEIELDGRS